MYRNLHYSLLVPSLKYFLRLSFPVFFGNVDLLKEWLKGAGIINNTA